MRQPRCGSYDAANYDAAAIKAPHMHCIDATRVDAVLQDETLFGHPKPLERFPPCDVVWMNSCDDPGFIHHERTVDELLAHGKHHVLSPTRRVHDAAPDFGNVCGI